MNLQNINDKITKSQVAILSLFFGFGLGWIANRQYFKKKY